MPAIRNLIPILNVSTATTIAAGLADQQDGHVEIVPAVTERSFSAASRGSELERVMPPTDFPCRKYTEVGIPEVSALQPTRPFLLQVADRRRGLINS